jgi:glycerophosphoryl diester phosphodiesterase
LEAIVKRQLKILFAGLLCLTATPASAACWDPRDVIAKAKDPNDGTAIIAMHRGLWLSDGNHLPENSMDSFIAADRLCIPAVETDVRMTKDKIPVMLHDQRLGRTAYVPGMMGSIVFDPEKTTNDIGLNPHVSQVTWYKSRIDARPSEQGIQNARLLNQPFRNGAFTSANVTGYPIETVESFYQNYIDNRLSLVVFLEIKDKNSIPYVLRQLYRDTRDYNYGMEAGKKLYATALTVIKFNGLMFLDPQEYRDALKEARTAVKPPADMPDPIAFPAYAPNSLQAIVNRLKGSGSGDNIDPYNAAIKKWIDAEDIRIGVEINNKEQGGILQDIYDKAVASKKTSIGTFHALPDYLRVNPGADPNKDLPNRINPNATIKAKDAFYQGEEGLCCYELKDLLRTEWKGKKDTQDLRYSPEWMIGPEGSKPRFKLITTDDFQAIATEVHDKDGQTEGFKRSPAASVLLSYRRPNDTSNPDERRKVQHRRFDEISEDWTDDGTIGLNDNYRAESDISMLPFNGNVYHFVSRSVSGFGTKVSNMRSSDGGAHWSAAFGAINGNHKPGIRPTVIRYDGLTWMFTVTPDDKISYRVWTGSNTDRWSDAALLKHYDNGITETIKTTSAAVPVRFEGHLYLFFRGDPSVVNPDANNELFYVRLGRGLGGRPEATAPVQVFGLTLDESDPVPIAFNGKLFVFTRGSEIGGIVYPQHLHCNVFDGTTWKVNFVVPGVELFESPAVTTRRGQISIFYKERLSSRLGFVNMQPNFCNSGDFKTRELLGPPQIRLNGSPALLP